MTLWDNSLHTLKAALKQRAAELGFSACGIAEAGPTDHADACRRWIEQGFHGEMHYLADGLERRLDSRLLREGARALIITTANYYADTEEGPAEPVHIPGEGIVARYARGDDYHSVIEKKLRSLKQWLLQQEPASQCWVYVDTGPLLERETAQRAGLGWMGKHTLLLNRNIGSYFFLGALVTSLPLPPDEPAVSHCGTCTRCIDACPTQAITAPYVLDARRCISYMTIEHRGTIPEEMKQAIADSGRIFGCDICQEVCPYTRKYSIPTSEPAFQPREACTHPSLEKLLLLTEEEFQEKFKHSPVKRAKRRGLLRNAAIALANSGAPQAEAALQNAAENDPEPQVRENAAWSLRQIRSR